MPHKQLRSPSNFSKALLPPETLIYTGNYPTEPHTIKVISYNPAQVFEKNLTDSKACLHFLKQYPNNINLFVITGLHNPQQMTDIAHAFGIHPMAMEDIMNVNQRVKINDYIQYLLMVVKLLEYTPLSTNKQNTTHNSDNQNIIQQQVSFILGKNFLILFLEKIHTSEAKLFESLKKQLNTPNNRIRQLQVDYLFYAFLDLIVDTYLTLTDKLNSEIETFEDQVWHTQTQNDTQILAQLQDYKRLVYTIKRAALPLRETTAKLDNNNMNALISAATRDYFTDLRDHVLQVSEQLDSLHNTLAEITNLYLSLQSNKMNETMKVLTVMSGIFIPLTFIAGIYGMNFDNMPELHYKHAYFMVLMFMLTISILLFFYFKYKKWF